MILHQCSPTRFGGESSNYYLLEDSHVFSYLQMYWDKKKISPSNKFPGIVNS